MPCYKPLNAYKFLNRFTEEGKNHVHIVGSYDGKTYESTEEAQHIKIPCGQCIGCRIDRSRDWSLRCMHEASLYPDNCFITLTFSPEYLDRHNVRGTLIKSDFQKFMKRLRKFNANYVWDDLNAKYITRKNSRPQKVRYFHCGEYGSNYERPHHHACIFNFDFLDKTLWNTKQGVQLYRSAKLEELWPFGFCTIGEVTTQSAAYVARYITKKINGDLAASHYARYDDSNDEWYYLEPEYITMSRRPGIAREWYEKFKMDAYPKDFLTLDGKNYPVPAYYDKIYDSDFPDNFRNIQRKRLTKAKANADNNRYERLVARERVQKAKCKKLIRSYENASTNVLDL